MNKVKTKFKPTPDYEVEGDYPTTDEIPAWLSAREWVELRALVECFEQIKRPSMIHASLHRKAFERLRRNGMVLWKYPHPELGAPMASIEPTERAIALVGRFE